jgi:threonine dehydratase
MADLSTTLPLEAKSIAKAYEKIQDHIHRTPLLTNKTINKIASTSRNSEPAPGFNLFFKCENYQRIGAFKARGAFHAVTHLIAEMGLEEVRRRGVVTHSSGMTQSGD